MSNKNIIGHIINAEIVRNGLIIEFETDSTIKNHNVVEILFNDRFKPFDTIEVKIKGRKLLVKGVECGYWATKISRKKDFDLRELIGYGVHLVTDKEELKRINEQSCWC